MDYGTTLFFEKQLGFEESAKKAAKAGFKYIDFDLTGTYKPSKPSDEEKYFEGLRKITEDLGMKISQTHAPYVKGLNTDYKIFLSKEFSDSVKVAIRRAALLKSPYIVFHPFYPYPENYENVVYDYSKFQAENIKINLEVISSFKDLLKEYGVKMALENLNAHDFVNRKAASTVCCTSKECNAFIDALGEENYAICLDAGHLNLVDSEPMADFIAKLGKRIQVLHLHDNFGIQNDWFGELDRHLLPYFGCMNWEKLNDSLKKIGYEGIYSFECISYGDTDFTDEYYSHVYKAAKKIFGE